MKRFAAVLAVLLALTACKPGPTTQPATTPAQAPKPPSQLDVYRECVGSTRSKQDACQMKAWGYTFSDDDNNWACRYMGDWLCGPAERKA